MNTTPVSNLAVEPMTLTPIGVVETSHSKVSDPTDYAADSRVVLLPEFLPALTGIEYFSHLWVIYHQHRSADWRDARGWGTERVQMHPDTDDRAGQGLFASRAPVRPSALGSSIVQFVRREGTVLMERSREETPWHVHLASGSNFVEFQLAELHWGDASAVMNAKESDLLSARTKNSALEHDHVYERQ
jgi:tRNA (Thr-GGU) A37 N-methylase